ncbi:MAG: aldehyde dehydrogenase family protein [Planctomycetota bacterium]
MDETLFIGGKWGRGGPALAVRNKYSGDVIGTIATARAAEVDAALAAAADAVPVVAALPAFRRSEILAKAAALLRERAEPMARVIAAEAGKALKFARIEVDRAVGTIIAAAEEAKRIHGETVPLDAIPSGQGYFGFWVRRPVGLVVAIAPFNFPLNLVVHKVAPAIAAGNALVLKPASATPLTAAALCRILEESGIPPGGINLVVGSGGDVGDPLVADPRVAKVTFTGSRDVGARILARAGVKKVTLELGNAAPVVITAGTDLGFAARRCAVGAFYNSGQVCISVQRIYVEKPAYAAFLEKFIAATNALVVGDPLDETTDVGPMISELEAKRVEAWVAEATAGGASVTTGGRRDGSVYAPTILTGVKPGMKVVDEEIFGPVAVVSPVADFDEGLARADATAYGLQAAVFTRDVNQVLRAVRRLNFGGVIVNDTPNFRADHMPYGGTRQSGLGREGVRYAIEEMTNLQMVVIREEGI